MDIQFRDALNEMLTETYRGVSRYEEQLVARQKKMKLTIGEIHTLETIGKAGPRGLTITQIAQFMDLTAATVVVAVSRLEKKGYVNKTRATFDRRNVFVTLTTRGRAADRLHKQFHYNLVSELMDGLDDEEKRVLLGAMDKLSTYFSKASTDR